MYILSEHRELSKQIKIHEIAETFLAKTLHQIPPFFFFLFGNNNHATYGRDKEKPNSLIRA
jgi:hypothetical protein